MYKGKHVLPSANSNAWLIAAASQTACAQSETFTVLQSEVQAMQNYSSKQFWHPAQTRTRGWNESNKKSLCFTIMAFLPYVGMLGKSALMTSIAVTESQVSNARKYLSKIWLKSSVFEIMHDIKSNFFGWTCMQAPITAYMLPPPSFGESVQVQYCQWVSCCQPLSFCEAV